MRLLDDGQSLFSSKIRGGELEERNTKERIFEHATLSLATFCVFEVSVKEINYDNGLN